MFIRDANWVVTTDRLLLKMEFPLELHEQALLQHSRAKNDKLPDLDIADPTRNALAFIW